MDLTLPMRTAGEQPRVLVIERNRNYLAMLARRLGGFGYRVATAESAPAGLAEMYRIPVALVVCDVNLPGTSGIELARMIREDPVNRDIPVLLVVGRSNPTAAVESFEAGADGVIRKPCRFEVLAACIARHLKRAEALKRLCDDKDALDAKIVSRVIELGEIRERLRLAEIERRRLAEILEGRAA